MDGQSLRQQRLCTLFWLSHLLNDCLYRLDLRWSYTNHFQITQSRSIPYADWRSRFHVYLYDVWRRE